MIRGKYVTEFHVHTKASRDSLLSKTWLYIACRLRHVDCIAITDHDLLTSAIQWKSWFEKRGIRVIPGEEIFTTEGEIIGLFLSSSIAPGKTPEETVREIKQQGGIVYLPHPYDEKRYKTVLSSAAIARLSSSIDCGEIHNGRNIRPEFSSQQERIVLKHGIQPIIGGDSHCFFEVGRNVCLTEKLFTKDSFSEVLSSAQFVKKKCIKSAHKVTILARLCTTYFEGGSREVCRVVIRRVGRSFR